MEYSGQYLSYEDYRILGGTLDLASFNLLEFEARRKIDIKTFNRLKNVEYEELPQEVKLCEYKMINSISSYEKSASSMSSNSNIASENIDGYSVSYIAPSQISELIKSKSVELDDVIRDYLLGVVFNGEHIMFCGVNNAC